MCWNLGPTYSFEYEFSYCMRQPWLFNVCDWKWDLCTYFLSDILKLVLNIHSDEKKLKWPPYSMKGVIYGGRTEVLGLLSLPHTRLHFFLSFPCDIAVLIWAPLMVSVRKGLFQDPKISPRKMLTSVPLQIRFCMSLVMLLKYHLY